MSAFLILFLHIVISPFKMKARLEAEIVMLRHQLNVLRRQAPSKPKLTAVDRLLFVWLCRLFPALRDAITIVQPDTVLRWHRSGFRLYWWWKSRSRGGRPKVAIEIRSLIRRMSVENPLWGAPRIHGELLKLGIAVAQSTVAKYMAKRRPGSGQTWKTFLRNHAVCIGTMDFLVVPTINFRLVSVLVILRHERRRLISLSVTDHPTAEWIAQQITEATGQQVVVVNRAGAAQNVAIEYFIKQPADGYTVFLSSAALGVNVQDAVTIHFSASAIPEPAAWLLMLAGMFSVGGALRRRRRMLREAQAVLA